MRTQKVIELFMSRCNGLGLYTLDVFFSVAVAYVATLDTGEIAYSCVQIDKDAITLDNMDVLIGRTYITLKDKLVCNSVNLQ